MSESNVHDPVLHELNRKAHQAARAAKRYVEGPVGSEALYVALKNALREYEKADRRAQKEATL